MAQDGFRSIRLKEAVLEAVENYILAHPELGYKGIADFVTDAVREKLIALNATENTKRQGVVQE